ncbi:MAG TPA: dihydropteroate synthase, partial [Nitrospirota bacterium]|nr:dihydropteroate synthase [Nitrospirota bacterium]
GHGTFSLTVNGLTSAQMDVLHGIVRASYSSTSGAGLGPAPSFSPSGAQQGFTISGSPELLRRIARNLPSGSCLPSGLAEKIESLLDNYLRSDYKIDCRGKTLGLGARTHIMGVLNVTPDSFSDGGRYADPDQALARARDMAAAGADIIDIGGESTRPGAEPVPEDEELRRTVPLIERLAAELAVPISIDTYKSSVARKALEAGASIVNDISGLRFSPDMARVAAEYGAAVVIMHIKGTPKNMQQNPVYADVVDEVRQYLEEGVELAVKGGVDRERIMIDPGIGFGKNLGHNLEILNRLDEFKGAGRPVVLGTSRKKFIGTVLDIPVPEDRGYGTAATVALGIARGAAIVRVHDVADMAQVARMTDAIVKSVHS